MRYGNGPIDKIEPIFCRNMQVFDDSLTDNLFSIRSCFFGCDCVCTLCIRMYIVAIRNCGVYVRAPVLTFPMFIFIHWGFISVFGWSHYGMELCIFFFMSICMVDRLELPFRLVLCL